MLVGVGTEVLERVEDVMRTVSHAYHQYQGITETSLVVGETDLVLRLTSAEKVEGIHSDLRAPLNAVTGVEVLDNAHGAADIVGLRAGTRVPRVIEVASVTG